MSTDDRRNTIGVIGLGTMGGRAATALAASGRSVVGYDVDPTAAERAAAEGVTVVAGCSEVAARAAVVLLSLPGPADVLSVVDELATSGEEQLVVDLSTIDPATARDAARRLGRVGARYVDAPVLGRPVGIGNWTLPAGGAEADVRDVRELTVGVLAKAVEHVGDVGTGSAVKVLNNLMFGAINAVTAEVLDLAVRFGLAPERFAEVVADSGAATASPLFRDVAPRMAAHDHGVVFSLALLHKDVGLGVAMARELGAPAEISNAVYALTGATMELGHGQQDTSSVIELLDVRRDTPHA